MRYSHLPPRLASLRWRRKRAFTLIELLVSCAVLAIMVVLIAQVISMSSSSISLSSKRLDSLAEGRFVMDRLGRDWASRLRRGDIDIRILKNEDGNDLLEFYSEVQGYAGARRVSFIGYRVQESAGSNQWKLERGVQGSHWENTGANSDDDGDPPPAIKFRPDPLPTLRAVDYEIVGDGIFRLEVSYLKNDGNFTSSSINDYEDISGLIVTVALMDPQSRDLLTSEQMESLISAFPDSEDHMDTQVQWQTLLSSENFGAGIPQSALRSIRIMQRHYDFH